MLIAVLALRGYSNGKYIIPQDNVVIPENAEVIITFLDDVIERTEPDLAWFKKFCAELNSIDEELPKEFDEILSERFTISRELDL